MYTAEFLHLHGAGNHYYKIMLRTLRIEKNHDTQRGMNTLTVQNGGHLTEIPSGNVILYTYHEVVVESISR